MTQYPPPRPGPPGPWGPPGPPNTQPPTFEYPEYPGYGGQPYGYGLPPQGYPSPYPPPPTPPRAKNKTAWWIAGGVLSVALVAALVIGGVFLVRGGGDILVSSDEAEITQLVEDFSAAGNTGKFSELGQYFCANEAAMFGALGELGQILEGIEIPQTAPTTDMKATNIKVKGDVASATVEPGGSFDTAYFRKENGQWKVCMSAAVEFNQR